MKLNRKVWTAIFATLAMALFFLPSANASCGQWRAPAVTPSSWNPQLSRPSFMRAGFASSESENGIVGLWHVKFVSKGSGAIAPDGAEIDAGYAQWHSDHTEIMNSGGRPPLTGSFCLGVWAPVGERTYTLNHFAASYDGTGLNLVGPTNIQETVTLDRSGNSFVGTFTIDAYTEAGNRVVHLQGIITGTRITVSTPPTSVF